ncbi:response regulator transcription factor [Spirosoma endophyticum]|uniref:Two component transcriptional regulator, LuxR family n=1 Tax=Spirosoma endophyticum TaxID=662367 RepID=A0A1I1SGK5_9BACT|nr:response regulator transcription factor [Spirosoma endophyticum]SFD45609.1 two component transcriptional regulator, LuxR family [Spirosoma endophyticum]
MNSIRVAIADDQLLFRKGMMAIVDTFEGIAITLEADNGRALLDALATADPLPDVVLLDLSMPELNGVETIKLIHRDYPTLKIIILSVYSEDRFLAHLMDLGVNAYLFKNVEPQEVERAIRAVVETDFYFNEAFLNALKNRMLVKKPHRLLTDDLPATLTSREIEVLNLICKQLTAPEIADRLSLSIRTVDGHRANLLEQHQCPQHRGSGAVRHQKPPARSG